MTTGQSLTYNLGRPPIAQGHNNAQIAQQLAISRKTVRNHVSNILNKLQAADRAEAIIRARKAGLGNRPG